MIHQHQVLGVECPLCKHRKVFRPADLIDSTNVGEMASLAALLRRMRCASCGARYPDGMVLPGADGEEWAKGRVGDDDALFPNLLLPLPPWR
ncbi:hypothetical protein [Ancylobacter moscoviensis]|uniref:hypothetical protein n=1 Tax=Ancylobacter moscoviensis TaxID=2597768 RepID=UPI001186D849|nr:hypothetical protein [Ancylobacter moscoviensis]